MRRIRHEYQDPVELIWVETAARLGIRVVRSATVFASWDGAGKLTLGTPETLDPDDHLGQLILHECCHAMVEGPESTSRPDWGLENVDDRHAVAERACLRLQAGLASPHGLREFMAATTDYRAYYDGLPEDPLEEGPDPALVRARVGWERAMAPPWREPIQEALGATRQLLEITRPFSAPASLWSL